MPNKKRNISKIFCRKPGSSYDDEPGLFIFRIIIPMYFPYQVCSTAQNEVVTEEIIFKSVNRYKKQFVFSGFPKLLKQSIQQTYDTLKNKAPLEYVNEGERITGSLIKIIPVE